MLAFCFNSLRKSQSEKRCSQLASQRKRDMFEKRLEEIADILARGSIVHDIVHECTPFAGLLLPLFGRLHSKIHSNASFTRRLMLAAGNWADHV